jgi:hypothetical protein
MQWSHSARSWPHVVLTMYAQLACLPEGHVDVATPQQQAAHQEARQQEPDGVLDKPEVESLVGAAWL